MMKYFNNIVILFLFVLLFSSSCSENAPSNKNTTKDGITTVQEFSKLITDETQLIDVRTPAEVADGYIMGAKNIDFRHKDFNTQILSLNKSKPVLVYCKSGGRSGKTYTILKEHGFGQVFDLKGGFSAWTKAKKPIVK